MPFFPFIKLENRRIEQVLPGGRLVSVGKGRSEERVKEVGILCTHVCKCKMIPVETVPGMWRRGNKGEWLRG
jgi:hypothetical protein